MTKKLIYGAPRQSSWYARVLLFLLSRHHPLTNFETKNQDLSPAENTRSKHNDPSFVRCALCPRSEPQNEGPSCFRGINLYLRGACKGPSFDVHVSGAYEGRACTSQSAWKPGNAFSLQKTIGSVHTKSMVHTSPHAPETLLSDRKASLHEVVPTS